MKVLLLINEKSGAVQKTGAEAIIDMAKSTAHALGDISVDVECGDAPALIDMAESRNGFDVIAAAGGDGTQAAIAGALEKRSANLLPLPCGTMNLLCRDLRIPLDIESAFQAGFSGEVARIDIGKIDGRVFLNNVVFGAYADLAEAREELRDADTLQDVSFSVVAAADALMNADPVRFHVEADGETFDIMTNTIAISNNEISHAEGLAPQRRSLNAGALFAYLADATDAGAFAALLTDFARGAADKSDAIRVISAKECVVGANGARFSYSVDGDPVESDRDVTLNICPKALNVVRPRSDS